MKLSTVLPFFFLAPMIVAGATDQEGEHRERGLREESRRLPQQLSRRLRFGKKNTLVVRVKSNNGVRVMHSKSNLNLKVFGRGKPARGSDPYTPSSQIEDCSYGKYKLQPFNGILRKSKKKSTRIQRGVHETTVDFKSRDPADLFDFGDETFEHLKAELGNNFDKKFDFIFLCLPLPGAGQVFAFPGYPEAFMNQEACDHSDFYMFAMGKAMGFDGSHEGRDKFGDTIGLMGDHVDRVGELDARRCFNGPHSWDLGWYKNKHTDLGDVSKSSFGGWEGNLVGISDYRKAFRASRVILRLEAPKTKFHYFVTFNRQAGITEGTGEAHNQVTVHKRSSKDPLEYERETVLVAKLREGRQFTIKNFDNSGKDVTIKVLDISNSRNPWTAKVSVTKR